MRNVIIPVEVTNEDAINLNDVTSKNLVVVYNDKEAIGFVICSDGDWAIQFSSDCENVNNWYTSLSELIKEESKKYFNFNLKVL